jgi:starvation-inducible DNA-binding protein
MKVPAPSCEWIKSQEEHALTNSSPEVRPELGISADGLQSVAKALATLLADEVLLYLKTRNFHWNVVGPNFIEMHKFFESQYEELDEILDEVAERIRSIGSRAPGSMAEFLRDTRLSESDGKVAHALGIIEILLADHETVIRGIRNDLEIVAKAADAGTEDFLVGLLEQHEKMAWMLRSHVQ